MDIYDKSYKILQKIIKYERKYKFKIYLLGGWAVWLYNPYMKSKDIDFIVEKKYFWKFKNFAENIGFRETTKVMQKHGFTMSWEGDEIELDVYTEKIGKWNIENLTKNFNKIKKIRVLSPTNLFLLKAYTALERRGTPKGEKDLSDLIALLDKKYKNIDFSFVRNRMDLKKVLNIVFSDFALTSRIYPIELKKYKKIKSHLEGFL